MPQGNKIFAGVILALALFAAASPARAAQFSGNYLLAMCASDKDGRELTPGGHIACQAYISGVMDYHSVIHSLGLAPSVDFCIPENATLNDLQNVVAAYLEKYRNVHGAFIAAPAVALALFNAYPCQKKKK